MEIMQVIAPGGRNADDVRAADRAAWRTALARRDRGMPRFFFHFHDGIIEESDDEGIVLATRAVAATQGRRAVLMIVGEDDGAFDWSRWLLTILHEDGSCVLRLPFQSVIEDLKTSFQ